MNERKRVRQPRENQRRNPPGQHAPWWKRVLRLRWKMVWVLVLCVSLPASLLALNKVLIVKYWDIDAPKPVVAQLNDWMLTQVLDFWHARPSLLREKILYLMPDVAEVQIQRHLPDRMTMIIRMRQPLALWENSQGEVHLVDEQGVVYRRLENGEYMDLPMLRVQENQVRQACRLLRQLNDSPLKQALEVSELRVDLQGWRMIFSKGQQWFLPFGEKAVHNIALLNRVVQKKPWRAGIWRINTRLGHRWFFRPVNHKGVI